MITHEQYDENILKQITRIANALDRISKQISAKCENKCPKMDDIEQKEEITDIIKNISYSDYCKEINEIAQNTKQEKFEYASVQDIIEYLKTLPIDSKVLFNGYEDGYISSNIGSVSKFVSFNDDSYNCLNNIKKQ